MRGHDGLEGLERLQVQRARGQEGRRRTWRTAGQPRVDGLAHERGASLALTVDGRFEVDLWDPKVSLFFLSLFPQFATGELLSRSPITVAACFLAGNTLWYVLLVLVVGLPGLRERMRRFQAVIDCVFAVGFVALGSVIVIEELVALGRR